MKFGDIKNELNNLGDKLDRVKTTGDTKAIAEAASHAKSVASARLLDLRQICAAVARMEKEAMSSFMERIFPLPIPASTVAALSSRLQDLLLN